MSKAVKIGVWSTFILAFLFILTLVGHIAYMVGNRPAASFYQLARVDFAQPPTATDEQRIAQAVQSQKGAIDTYFNQEAKTMVFKYDTRYTTADAIFQQAIRKLVPNSKQFIVPASMAAAGCPVFNDKSFYGRLTNLVATLMY